MAFYYSPLTSFSFLARYTWPSDTKISLIRLKKYSTKYEVGLRGSGNQLIRLKFVLESDFFKLGNKTKL